MFNSTIISTKRQPDKAKNPVNSHCRQAKLSNENLKKKKLYRPLTIMDTLDRVLFGYLNFYGNLKPKIIPDKTFFFFFLFFFFGDMNVICYKRKNILPSSSSSSSSLPVLSAVKKINEPILVILFYRQPCETTFTYCSRFFFVMSNFFLMKFSFFFWIQNSKYSKCFEFKILDGTVSVVSNHFSNLD